MTGSVRSASTYDREPGHSMSDAPDQYTVMLYSDDKAVRDKIRLAIGVRPAADLRVEFADASTWEECRILLDKYEIDLMVLDGEAAPAGGLGIARQTKDEYATPPPVCVVLARAADRWLAAYAQVDQTLIYPLDPVTTGQTIAGMLRDRRNGVVPLGTMGSLG
jgi:DNA-binding response OmpR family regulator